MESVRLIDGKRRKITASNTAKKVQKSFHRNLQGTDKSITMHPVEKHQLFDKNARNTFNLTDVKNEILELLEGVDGVSNPGVEPGYYYYENEGVVKADREMLTEKMMQITKLQPYVKTCNRSFGRVQKFLFCRLDNI